MKNIPANIRNNSILFIITSLIIIASLLHFIHTSVVDQTKFIPESESDWTTDWMINNTSSEMSFPMKMTIKSGDTLTLSCRLPAELMDNEAIYYNASYCAQQVYIGNQLIYEFGVQPQLSFSKMRGSAYVLADIPKEYAGKTLTIIMTNPYETTSFLFEGVKIGQRGQFQFLQLRQSMWRYGLFFVFSYVAIMLFLFGINLYVNHTTDRNLSFIYFAIMIFSVGLWVFCDPSIMQFFTNKTTVVQYLSILCLLVIGTSYTGLCASFFKNQSKIFRSMEFLGYVLTLAMIALYFSGIKNPTDFIFPICVYGMLYLSVSFIELIIHFKEYNFSKTMLLGIILLSIGVGMTIYRFVENPSGTEAVMPLLTGFTLYAVCLFSIMIKDAVAVIHASTKSALYQHLAFTDELTNIPNRAAFERDLDLLQNDTLATGTVTLFMIDLNNLKRTNDVSGHESGDQLIKAAATCIANAFCNDESYYRIGGDEFVVLAKNIENNIDNYLQRLEKEIERENQDNAYDLSMAIGIATRPLPLHNESHEMDIFREADQKMYENKKKMHSR